MPAHIKGEDNVVAGAFSRLCDHHPMDGESTEMLTAFLMAGNSIGSNAPIYVPRSNSNSKPVTTEPSIDPSLRTKIEAAHNSVSRHFSVEYTRKALFDSGVDDDGLRRAINKFVRDCPVCQLRSVLNRQIKTHRFTTASYTPMEVLNIDTIGSVSKDSANNCYILVIIDCFTRFVELYPVSDTSAVQCARALLSHICRYGTPMTIRSDRGTQFVNDIISQLLSFLQIDHELSLAYSKEQNAIVERERTKKS
jgi:transposase InsO family protein